MPGDVTSASPAGARTGLRPGSWCLNQVPGALAALWDRWFRNSGDAIQQTYLYAAAWASAAGADRVWAVWSGRLLSAFRVEDNRAVCLFAGAPALGDWSGEGLRELAEQARDDLGTAVVYFPHMRRDAACSAQGRFSLWQRLPSSVLHWSDRGSGLPERVRRRYGSRAERQWRRFERSGLTVAAAAGEAAVSAISCIERRSWKAAHHQSMHQRENQLVLYSTLIGNGLVQVDVAYDDSHPVAYRMDARVGSTVTCLKWSFDEAYRRFSPGFHLLTAGLVDRWARADIRCIDLFGSPDTLKALIRTGTYPRYDLAWPTGPAADAIRIEREQHDAGLLANHEAGRGIRHAYRADAGG